MVVAVLMVVMVAEVIFEVADDGGGGGRDGEGLTFGVKMIDLMYFGQYLCMFVIWILDMWC